MYEKHGLMSKLNNPEVLAYLRSNQAESHTRIIERALRQKLGLAPKMYIPKCGGRRKSADCQNGLPVKVVDPVLVRHLITQRTKHGISHRYTIEIALLEMMKKEKAAAENGNSGACN